MLGLQEKKQRHFEMQNIGLRAQATAVGMLQICAELRRGGLLDEAAIERIKGAIADEIEVATPRQILSKGSFMTDVRQRLDRLFAGEKPVGEAQWLDMAESAVQADADP